MKRIEEMTVEELWELFPIVLVPYDERWAQWAEEEMERLRGLLSGITGKEIEGIDKLEGGKIIETVEGPEEVEMYHIGSTAVRGIWAKPTVDILVVVSDAEVFPGIKARLLGEENESRPDEERYLLMNEGEGRMTFAKGYTPRGYAERVFHIHVRAISDSPDDDCKHGNSDKPGRWDRDEVYFCDYLNAAPEVAKEYEALKLGLWKKYEHDRDRYTEAKTEFVRRYTAIAKARLSKP